MNKTSIYKFLFLILPFTSCLILISSCTQLDVFEKNTAIPKYEWQSNFSVTGSFNIADTISPCNIYLILRHTDAYKYNNIWLKIGLQQPGDTMREQKINLELGNDITGWEGSGMNDIWEIRKLLNQPPTPFKKAGTYHYSISQIMRDDPLTSIMSAGLRVEVLKRN